MTVAIYFLKLIACSALFFSYYFFMLRNRRMHQYNRFYLLASVVLSIILPFIKLPLLSIGNKEEVITKTLQGIVFGGWEQEVVVTAKLGFYNSLITAQNILVSIYITGLILAVYPVLSSLAYIRSLSQKYRSRKLHAIHVYNTDEPGTPFSFFNNVFWNDNIPMETEEGQQILRHELYHIRQKHSYDILFMQVVCSFLWFNPFCYLIYKELKIIHEFLADEHAAFETDRHHYAKLLLLQASSPKKIFLSNQFFYHPLKRRITMILHHYKTRYSFIRKSMAIPLLLIVFCACSVKSKDEQKLNTVAQDEIRQTIRKKILSVHTPPAEAVTFSKDSSGNYDPIFTKVEIESSYPKGPKAWLRYLNKTFKYPQAAQDNEIQGTVIIQFIVDKEGIISDVQAIAGPANGGLRDEAARVIRESGKWDPAVQNGRKVSSYKKQPITFKLEAQ